MNKLTLLIVSFLLVACRDKTPMANKEKNLYFPPNIYHDMDILQLKGIEGMDTLTYPCFQILNMSDTQRVVTLFYSKDKQVSKVFNRIINNWVCKLEFQGDTCRIYTVEVINGKQLFEFSYSDSTYSNLLDLQISDSASSTIWVAKKGTLIEPKPDKVGTIESKSVSIYSEFYQVKDNVINIMTKSVDRIRNEVNIQNACYNSNSRSWYWWMNFNEMMKKIDCP